MRKLMTGGMRHHEVRADEFGQKELAAMITAATMIPVVSPATQ
jgi:hypothetical protein